MTLDKDMKELTMDYTYIDFRQKLDTIFTTYNTKSATVYLTSNGGKTVTTYGEIKAGAENLEYMLKKHGLCRADRIAIIAKHSVFATLAVVSLTYLGYTIVVLDAALPIEEQNRLLKKVDARAIFTTPEIYYALNREFLSLIPVFCICEKENSYELFADAYNGQSRFNTIPTAEDVIAVIFSSGTTGSMKGIEITYTSIIKAYECMIEYTSLNENMRFFNVLPINHIAGFSTAISCSLCGAEMGFVPEVNARYLSYGFINYNPSGFIMVPKVYEVIKDKIEVATRKNPLIHMYFQTMMMLSGFIRKTTGFKMTFCLRPIIKRAMGKNIAICGCGTAPCSEDVIQFYLHLGLDFVNVYGATETGFPITAMNWKKDKYLTKSAGSVYQFPEIKIEIDHPDENGIGEILVKSPLAMKGYFNDPKLTRDAFNDRHFFKTGDLGYIDENGYLNITGRSKEAILLRSGKKVSPSDIDKYYQKICSRNCLIASCGVPVADAGYDEIHLFLEAPELTEIQKKQLKEELLRKSKQTGAVYQISYIHFVDKIPITSVGKVKRYLLRDSINIETACDNHQKVQVENKTILETVITLIQKCVGNSEVIYENSDLEYDLGIDSLTMMEVCNEIEETFGIFIGDYLDSIHRVSDIVDFLEQNEKNGKHEIIERDNTLKDFPVKKRWYHKAIFNVAGWLTTHLWKLEVEGVENIPIGTNYVVCANHQSHLDGISVWKAMRGKRPELESIGCMAANEHMGRWINRLFMNDLGGIPVDREHNTTPAIRRTIECLESGKYCILIHPEGTRTRTGKMNVFKKGAADIAIKSKRPILPVRLEGTYDILPPGKYFPKLICRKPFGRCVIKVRFGKPIYPTGENAKSMMEKVEGTIRNL